MFDQYFALRSAYYSSYYPDDTPLTQNRVRLWLEDEDEDSFNQYFLSFFGTKVVGYMDFGGYKPSNVDYELNRELGWLSGYVYPEHRRQGIGRRLSRTIMESAKECGLKKLGSGAFEEGGNRFCEFLGGILISKFSDRLLNLENVKWSLVDEWKKIGDKLDIGWKVEFHSKITDDFVECIVDLDLEIMQELRAMGNMEYRSTREGDIKNWQENAKWMEKSGDKYACFLIKDDSGKVVGFTEGGFNKDNPSKFSQYVTGVLNPQEVWVWENCSKR